MEKFILGIGSKIRTIRKQKKILGTDVAKKANVSNGLISRIENGRTIPSLPVLMAIIAALDEEPATFFKDLTFNMGVNYILIKPDNHQELVKEYDADGFIYESIFFNEMNSIGMEVVMLTLQPGCKRDVVDTDAYEFKYMIEGSCTYEINGEEVEINKGDALFFDGRLPHVPKNYSDKPAKMLVIYFFTS